jgi:mono/diheme cytochrome c family protein
MKQASILVALLLFVGEPSSAQDAEFGAELYARHCSVCHGAEARGGGPLAPALLLQPPSLREMDQLHGMFLTERIVSRIDGRDPLVSHGSPMPVYGKFFEGDDVVIETESGEPIMTSRPIADLVAYLKQIQE